MTDRFFLGMLLIFLLVLGGFTLYEHTELNDLELQVAQMSSEINQLKKEQRVNAQDIDFMRKLITGYEFREVEE